MGIKSRDNFATGICLKDCENRDKKCNECIGFSELKERNARDNKKKSISTN